MREFRKKQKRLHKIMRALIIAGAVFIFIYIGAKPMLDEVSAIASLICSYICDFLVIANMAVMFTYYNKYGKSDSFLERTEHEIDDYGFYYTARKETDEKSFLDAMLTDLKKDGFKISMEAESDGLDFDYTAFKKKEFFYVSQIESLSREDVIAYIDSVITDITVHNLKRSGNAVICFVTDKAEDGAVALSKMITPLGKKEQIKIAVSIIEPSSKKCFFLGNMPTKCQQMIIQYVMGTFLPLENNLKGERRLPFQDELEIHMQSFDIKEFKNGTFYAH